MQIWQRNSEKFKWLFLWATVYFSHVPYGCDCIKGLEGRGGKGKEGGKGSGNGRREKRGGEREEGRKGEGKVMREESEEEMEGREKGPSPQKKILAPLAQR